MKWIGQHIWDQVSKFRNTVEFHDTVDFAKDVTFYQPVNNADPTISIGSSDDERLELKINYQGTTTQLAQLIIFKSHTESAVANDGRFRFMPDNVSVLEIDDGGIDFMSGLVGGISFNGTDVLTDNGSGSTTLSNIDALDATTESTIESAIDTLANLTSITLDSVNITSMQSSSESFSDNDTSLMTSAAIDDRINAAVVGDITGITITADDTNTIVDTSGNIDIGIKGTTPLSTVIDGTDILVEAAAASASARGVVELATTAETTTGTDTGRAVTPDGLKDGYQGSANVTTLGTIGTGTWNGTAIASGYTKHVLHYSFRGYAAGLSSGNWQYAEDFTDAQFPVQLNSDYGNTAIASGSLTDVSTWFRSSGIVMPRSVSAISMFGWATCGGTTNNISIAICKITPTRNSTGAKTPSVVATITFPALNSNDKMEDFEQTSMETSEIAKGDILMPFVISPYDGTAKTTYFNVTLEVEG
jgi:hypothetical protein